MKKYSFLLMLVLIFISGILINDNTEFLLYNVSFSPVYRYGLLVLLGFGILLALELRSLRGFRKGAWARVVEVAYPFLFLLFAVYPIFRCYFSIPYIFCHQCPRKCVWGTLRPYAVPSLLIINLNRRDWCFRYCPFGKLQDLAKSVTKKEVKMWSGLLALPLLILIFIAVSYSIINQEAVYNYFFQYSFNVNLIVVGVAFSLLLLAAIIPRVFCNYVCPIGLVGKLGLRIQRWV